ASTSPSGATAMPFTDVVPMSSPMSEVMRAVCRSGARSGHELHAEALPGAAHSAGDGALGEPQRGRDPGLALSAHEEPLDDLALAGGQPSDRLMHDDRVVDLRERIVATLGDHLDVLHAVPFPRVAAEAVDRQAPRELTDPRPDRCIVAQLPKVLPRAQEDLLEDILSVLLAEAVGA